MAVNDTELTPMQQQYRALKEKNKDMIERPRSIEKYIVLLKKNFWKQKNCLSNRKIAMTIK